MHRVIPCLVVDSARVRAGASLYIFHGTLNKEWMKELLEEIGIVGAVLKNLGEENLDRLSYSKLWCTVEFYNNFSTTHLLCFQTDVLMRRRIPEKFFQYDYVGAPWTECAHAVMKDPPSSGCFGIGLHGVRDPPPACCLLFHGSAALEAVANSGCPLQFRAWSFSRDLQGMKHVGNGGYSLRNIAAMKRIISTREEAGEGYLDALAWHEKRGHNFELHEDLYLASSCDPEGLPMNHEAAEFSVERIWHPNPSGCHQPWTPASMVPLVMCAICGVQRS